LDDLGNTHKLVFGELTGADVGVDTRMLENFGSRRTANAKHVGKRSFDALLVGDFNA